MKRQILIYACPEMPWIREERPQIGALGLIKLTFMTFALTLTATWYWLKLTWPNFLVITFLGVKTCLPVQGTQYTRVIRNQRNFKIAFEVSRWKMILGYGVSIFVENVSYYACISKPVKPVRYAKCFFGMWHISGIIICLFFESVDSLFLFSVFFAGC